MKVHGFTSLLLPFGLVLFCIAGLDILAARAETPESRVRTLLADLRLSRVEEAINALNALGIHSPQQLRPFLSDDESSEIRKNAMQVMA